MQDGEGVSRDDIAAALLEVVAGRIPLDRIALKELSMEVKDWPYLDAEEKLAKEDEEADASYESITDTGHHPSSSEHLFFLTYLLGYLTWMNTLAGQRYHNWHVPLMHPMSNPLSAQFLEGQFRSA